MSGRFDLQPPLPTKVVHQFAFPTWIENIAVRSNGQLLVTLMTTPELHLIDPHDPSKNIRIHKFPGILALSGIVEVGDDVFYVTGGNYDVVKNSSTPGSYSLWKVNLKSFDGQAGANIDKVTTLPAVGLPNGLEAFNGSVLIADSFGGNVWQVDVETGKHDILIENQHMKAPAPPSFPIGINGIKIKGSYLYWTNTSTMMFCRVKIKPNGKAGGSVEIVADSLLVDDFVFDASGQAWFAHNILNTVGYQRADGQVAVVAGNAGELTVAGGTACQFGRRAQDRKILYLVTTGGLAAPANGATEGGKVVAIDTSRFTL